MNTSQFKTIAQLRADLSSRKISARELTTQYLGRARANPQNAWISLCEERALKQADSADALLAKQGAAAFDRQPLLGMPLGIKDLLTIDGVRTTCASQILDQYIPPYTATCVERLEQAGGISLGKLNMDEFAMGGSNENSAFGPVKHPQFADRVAGGSSGGSAAAVGSDQCVAALGTDTGGSIRLPASFCGIVGFKPSYGRISRSGVVAFASSLDQVGPMTHSVEDAALLFDVMAGPDPLDTTMADLPHPKALERLRAGGGVAGMRIGVPKEYWQEGLQPEVEKSVRKSLADLEKQGAKLVEVSLPHTPHSVAVYYILAVSEASSNLARYDGVRFGTRPRAAEQAENLPDFYAESRALFGSEVKRRIILGTFALSAGYSDAYFMQACRVRRLIQRDFLQAFQSVDLIAGPVAPMTAFKIGEKVTNPLQMYLNDIYTIPANLVGLPAASVPIGQDSQGLPIGLHLIGPQFEDARVLQAAHSVEGMVKNG